jgi:hypothetical protein
VSFSLLSELLNFPRTSPGWRAPSNYNLCLFFYIRMLPVNGSFVIPHLLATCLERKWYICSLLLIIRVLEFPFAWSRFQITRNAFNKFITCYFTKRSNMLGMRYNSSTSHIEDFPACSSPGWQLSPSLQ